MNFRPRPVGNEWTWQLREDDCDVIPIAGARVSTVVAARRFGSARFPASARGASDPPRPAITSQAQISSDGAEGGANEQLRIARHRNRVARLGPDPRRVFPGS
jgi:hypothetical protein